MLSTLSLWRRRPSGWALHALRPCLWLLLAICLSLGSDSPPPWLLLLCLEHPQFKRSASDLCLAGVWFICFSRVLPVTVSLLWQKPEYHALFCDRTFVWLLKKKGSYVSFQSVVKIKHCVLHRMFYFILMK